MPGYEAKFVHPLLKRHKCPICLFAMRNPVQTECGQFFCRDCLEPVLKRKPILCPLEKEQISPIKIFPDNACWREILRLDVHCNFMTSGCTWIGPLKELESHIASCKVQCAECGQYIQVLKLIKHKQNDCPIRLKMCSHCGMEVAAQAHVDKFCLKVLRSCPNGCDSPPMKLPELERHLAIKDGQCPQSEVDCPFKPYGCSFVSVRKNIPTHLEQYLVFHCQIQADCFVELKQQIEKNTAATQHLLERLGSLETRLNAVKRLQDAEQRVQLLGDQQERDSDGDQRTKINALVLLQGAEYSVLTELCKHCGKEVLSQEMQAHIDVDTVCSEALHTYACPHGSDPPQMKLPKEAIGSGNSSLVPGQLCTPHGTMMGDLPSSPNELGAFDNQHSEMSAAIPVETSTTWVTITVTNLVNTDNTDAHTSMVQETGGDGDDARPRMCGTCSHWFPIN